MAKILLVEDNQTFALELKQSLERDRHAVDHAACVSDGREYLLSYKYDALIFDWELPDGSGIELCRTLREQGDKTPVLMLTGRTNIDDRIQGLDVGAEDYLCKPCHPEELSARIRAILRRDSKTSELINLGNISIDAIAHAVFINGTNLHLSPTEFSILEVLARQPGTTISGESLVIRCSSNSTGLSRSAIRVYVSTMRKKFTDLNQDCPIKWNKQGYVFEI